MGLCGEAAWVGESEAGVTGRTFRQGRGENSRGGVVMVVDLGGGFAWEWSQDAAGVLHEASFEGNGCGQEQGVEWGQSKPSTM